MIPWIIVAGVTVLGAIATTFIEMLKEWAIAVISSILKQKWIQIVSDGIVSIIKQGKNYYKKMKVYVKRGRNDYYQETTSQRIDRDEIPEDIKIDLDRQGEKEVLRQKVR